MESSFFRAAAGRSVAVLVLVTCLSETTLLGAARFRLLDGAGRPVPGARVSIVGRAGSTLTGSAGELDPGALPPTPFELAVFSPSGAWLGLVRVERLAESGVQDLRLPSGSTAEVVVKESVAPSALAPPANAVTLVSRAELEEKRPSRLTETLDDVPGVWKSDESSSAVPSVRGLSRGRTLILLDDGRVSAERRAGPSASFVNPFSLENVEVVRGPGSVAYGSDALGGAVHAKTALPVPGVFAARYSLTAGAGGTPEVSGGLSLNIPVGSMAITVQAQQRRQSDYDKPEGTQENSSSHDRGALVRWLVPLGSGGSRLYLGVQIDESRDMGKPSADQLLTRTYYPEENSRRFSLGLDLVDVAGFSALEARGFLGSYQLVTNRLRFPVPGTTRRLQSSDVDASDASFRVMGRRSLGPATLRVGIDVNGRFGLKAIGTTQSYNASDVATTFTTETSVEDASRTDWGAFVEADLPLGTRFTLTGGLRGDLVKSRNTGGFFGDRSTSNGALSGFAAVSANLAPEWTASLQYAHGFRDPLLSDRYFRGISGRGFVVGNPDLDPETSDQFDVSLRGRLGPVSVAAFGYLYRISDLIERYSAGNDFNFRNRGEAQITGAELEASLRVAQGLVVRAAAATARGRVRDDGSFTTDIPPQSLSLTLDHAVSTALWWRARFLAVRRDDAPGPTEVVIPGYGRLDVSAGYRLTGLVGVSVAVRNAFDKAYPDSPDEVYVTAPGRGILATVSGSF